MATDDGDYHSTRTIFIRIFNHNYNINESYNVVNLTVIC